MAASVSQQFVDRFHLRLAPQVSAWFDGAWRERRNANSSYNEPLDPEQLLAEPSSNLWGGQMPADTIPIATDGEGDHLCLKIAADGSLSEVIAWRHDGGGWDHYGYSISEAIALDDWQYDDSSGKPAGLSVIVQERRACRKALDNLLRQACRSRGGERLGKSVGVPWREFRVWLHDPALMPAEIKLKLSEALKIKGDDLVRQDWTSALEHAAAVIKLRPDLAWPYAVAGWARERAGEVTQAIEFYSAGAIALGSTASFTEPWIGSQVSPNNKFSVQRLLELRVERVGGDLRDYLSAAAKHELRDYWLGRTEEAAQRGEHALAYQHLYAAGWDDYFSNDIDVILTRLITAAENAGSPALAALAKWHREACL